jgi:uncharacterized membrane protein YfcA
MLTLWVTLAVFITTALFSSAGYAGATAHLGIFALAGLPPEIIKPAALSMNFLVTLIVLYTFRQAGYFSWKLLLPFILFSAPMAFVGGMVSLDSKRYCRLIALALVYAAIRLIFRRERDKADIAPPPFWLAALSGAVIGFVAGLIGSGGGVFWAPLVMLAGWATPQETAGTAPGFILANSLAGFSGSITLATSFPSAMILWLLAAALGGWVGARIGSRYLTGTAIQRLIGVLLLFVAARLFFLH